MIADTTSPQRHGPHPGGNLKKLRARPRYRGPAPSTRADSWEIAHAGRLGRGHPRRRDQACRRRRTSTGATTKLLRTSGSRLRQDVRQPVRGLTPTTSTSGTPRRAPVRLRGELRAPKASQLNTRFAHLRQIYSIPRPRGGVPPTPAIGSTQPCASSRSAMSPRRSVVRGISRPRVNHPAAPSVPGGLDGDQGGRESWSEATIRGPAGRLVTLDSAPLRRDTYPPCATHDCDACGGTTRGQAGDGGAGVDLQGDAAREGASGSIVAEDSGRPNGMCVVVWGGPRPRPQYGPEGATASTSWTAGLRFLGDGKPGYGGRAVGEGSQRPPSPGGERGRGRMTARGLRTRR